MDLTGQRFGRLLVVCKSEPKIYANRQKVSRWNCVCDCGKIITVREQGLTSGGTKSCGCYRRDKNREDKTKYTDIDRELRIRFKGMKQRCYNKNSSNYKHYGGRGIAVCDEWLNDFNAFRIWAISNGYSKELTLDRIDVNGDYCPENCRWVTWQEQQNNRTSNHIIEYDGAQMTIADAARCSGESYSTVRSRVYRENNK